LIQSRSWPLEDVDQPGFMFESLFLTKSKAHHRGHKGTQRQKFLCSESFVTFVSSVVHPVHV
jgi:hypothetical protein